MRRTAHFLIFSTAIAACMAAQDAHAQDAEWLKPGGIGTCWDPGDMLNPAGIRSMWETIKDCDPLQYGWLQWFLAGAMYVTGGYLPAMLVAMFVIFTYMRTKSALYAGVVGALYLPISAFLFPAQIVSGGVVILMLVIGISIWYGLVRQADRRF